MLADLKGGIVKTGDMMMATTNEKYFANNL